MSNKIQKAINKEMEIAQESNTKIANTVMSILHLGSTANRDDPEDLARHFTAYIELCARDGIKITPRAAYQAMGIDASVASDWRTGRYRSRDQRYRDLINEVDKVCAVSLELLMADGKLNPATGIFWQKNYCGMKDDPIAETNVEIDEQQTPEQIYSKYADLLAEDNTPLPEKK